MGRWQVALIFFALIPWPSFSQRTVSLSSPAGDIKVTIRVADSIYYTIGVDDQVVMENATLALITDRGNPGIKSRITNTSSRQIRENIINPVPFKRRNIPDHYNELSIVFRGNSKIIFRAYDDGVAYRFATTFKDSVTIFNEIGNFRFAANDSVYFPKVQQREGLDIFHTSFEEPFRKIRLSDLKTGDVGYSPILVDGNTKTVITESDLEDYPGMFLRGTSNQNLAGLFARYPEREKVFGGEFKQPMVVSRKNYIAKTKGTRNFPWRVIAIARRDVDLLMNDLVYRLGKPADEKDWSWVKPGISTEEWICGINLHGVDFKAGLNTASYKYYIDFAAKTGMQYVMLDAGWSDPNDLFKVNPDMDLEEIASYARSKNIGLIYWTLSMTLERQLDEILPVLTRLNAKVLMTDFMDRDDQKMVNFYHRMAAAAAKGKLMIMFHGAFQNAGLERTYPNSITREGVLGSEYNIWSEKATPEHDLTLPFTRMIAGPMDYEPGFMVNVNKNSFNPSHDMLMSMGTRCHQLAMFVAYESPLQLFSGNPSDALEEDAYIQFLASIPTTWDETVVLDAKIGDYLLLARRKEHDWYLTAMTDWTARELTADLSFLGSGSYNAEICEDGVNASKHGSDYKLRTQQVNASSKLKINMAPGGGYVAKIRRSD